MGGMELLTVLGSTGSIGVNTLDVVRRWRERFGVHALVAGANVQLLARQIAEFRPRLAVVAEEAAREGLAAELRDIGLSEREWPQLECGAAGRLLAATAEEVDFVLSAIVGVAGLEATYEAVRLGKRIGTRQV